MIFSEDQLQVMSESLKFFLIQIRPPKEMTYFFNEQFRFGERLSCFSEFSDARRK